MCVVIHLLALKFRYISLYYLSSLSWVTTVFEWFITHGSLVILSLEAWQCLRQGYILTSFYVMWSVNFWTVFVLYVGSLHVVPFRVWGSLLKSGHLFLGSRIVPIRKCCMYIWKHVACICKCCYQVGVYLEEPLVGDKQTTHILNYDCFIITESTWDKDYNTDYLHRPLIFGVPHNVVMFFLHESSFPCPACTTFGTRL
jgi:hypothetical protein